MKFTIKLTANDYVKANWLAMRLSPVRRVLLALYFIALVSLFIGTLMPYGGYLTMQFGCLFGVGIAFGARIFILMPRHAKKIYQQQKSLQEEVEIEFTETHYMSSAPSGNACIPWGDFHKWKRNKEMLLIYRSDALMTIIPFRCFENQTDDVLEICNILATNLGKEKP